ncbi:pentatricopeptide repeat-containing protein At3g02330, mitochondrial-like [Cryptomeria japonica]|uniref:pentatricopeptide repeat-containing protein At3g02330, mitochondrial-like n=1 Tax=Cryptomeria japonica TaxID=3369 RepID=UPI0027DA135D|nr:pentatricopeptide repeat-containing protein At3g02330, mitochondrial-like [Cryptomeria japonica]
MGDLVQGLEIHQKIIECGFLSDVIVVTALIDMYAKFGSIQKASNLFDKMSPRDVTSWNAMIIEVAVANALVDMYAKCESIHKAHELFNNMSQRDVVSWNSMIVGYAQNGLFDRALDAFKEMQLAGIKPDSVTFSCILPACAQLVAMELAMEIHQGIVKNGFFSDIVVGTSLIDMYAKCGSLQKACTLFHKMPKRDVASWNAMIVGYAQNGLLDKSLDYFKKMRMADEKPESSTFACILPVCAKLGALEQGMEFHQNIIKSGFSSDVVVVTALIDMYAKCTRLRKARELFDKMYHPGIVSWNTMISGYAMHGYCKEALELFELMKHSGTIADHVSLICVLFACSHAGLLDEGCKSFIHMSNSSHKNMRLGEFVTRVLLELDPGNAAHYVLLSNIYADAGMWGNVQKNGVLDEALRLLYKVPNRDVALWTAMITACVQNGALDLALKFFEEMPQRNVVSWTAIISGYAQNGHSEKALEIFNQMQLAGVESTSATFASILPVCAKMGDLEKGMENHQKIIECNLLSDDVVLTGLIDMYAKCRSMQRALCLFKKMSKPDAASWTAIIAGYMQNGFVDKALEFFKQMQLAGVEPDSSTFASILPAYASMGDLEQGKKIHQKLIESGFLSDTVVTALIDMYAKCGSIQKAN